MDAFAPHPVEAMADSGGFSAWSLGRPVALQAYIDWLHRWKHRLHVYANLDDITDERLTIANQREMEAQGLRPLPIFHYGERWETLDAYISRYPYVMLGGMAGVRERSWYQAMPWLIQCFKRGASSQTAFHGLGVSAQKVLDVLPFYSADASTYMNAVKYGMLGLFDRRRSAWEFILANSKNLSPHHVELLRDYGLSVDILRKHLPSMHAQHTTLGAGRGPSPQITALASCAAAAWMQYEASLRERHGLIRRRDDERPGLRYYIVLNTARMLECSSRSVGMKKLLDDLEAEDDARRSA